MRKSGTKHDESISQNESELKNRVNDLEDKFSKGNKKEIASMLIIIRHLNIIFIIYFLIF